MSNSPNPDAAAIRDDIDHTRQRMDATINALGERFQPRHLLDEALGYVRQNHTSLTQPLNSMREKLSQKTDAAMHAVVDTVKQNPVPLLLMGAGVAWMIYNHRRTAADERYRYERDDRYERYGHGEPPPPFRGTIHYDPDAHVDRPLEYPTAASGLDSAGGHNGAGSTLEHAKERVADAAHTAREKLAQAGDYAREKFDAARERAGEFGHHVRERTGEFYTRARDGVSHTVERHPLETGLICLAAGVLAGLAIPTPAPVNRRLGPVVDRLKDRALDTAGQALQAGRRATEAAVAAAKAEVKSVAPSAAPGDSTSSGTATPQLTNTATGSGSATASSAPTGPTVSVSPSS